jgi:hypothetical protein
MSEKQVIKRLQYLCKMIAKYAHRYDVSYRVHKWVDEYNDLKSDHREGAWIQFCDLMNFDPHHDGHDCRA